jgi:hypothetical protein
MDAVIGLVMGLLFGILVLLILGWVLHWLWNTTIPDVFGAKRITVVQAIKLLFIASILFGGNRVVMLDAADAIDAPMEAQASPE